MHKIDPAMNRIAPLEAKRLGELGFTECKHLQEWLENCPQALAQGDCDCEEMPIIQKAFDGFDDTRERSAASDRKARGTQLPREATDGAADA